MKPFIYLLLPVLLVSCNRYQYLTINSRDAGKNDRQEFVLDNDSLQIVYNFSGRYTPVNITIKNKLDKPIFVDWKRSALIINGKALSYSPDEVAVNGTIKAGSVNWSNNFSATQGYLSAVASLPPDAQMVPPQSFISRRAMTVTGNVLKNFPDSAYHRAGILLWDGTTAKARKAVFGDANSPLEFKSYLTVLVGDKEPARVAYQSSFYVSEIYNTTTIPKGVDLGNAGNRSFVSEVTGFGKGAGGVVLAASVVGGVAVAAAGDNTKKN